jgi:hypothetical protein
MQRSSLVVTPLATRAGRLFNAALASGAPAAPRAARSTRTLDGMNMRRRIVWFLPLVPLAILAIHYVRQFISVDRCLDRGGVFDYSEAACRFDVTMLPYVTYATQYRFLVFVTLFLSAALLVWAIVRDISKEGRG